MNQWFYQPAVSLARSIREKKIRSLELLELFIERYEQFNSRINAIVWTDIEHARKSAIKADQALARGEVSGVLHGVPMTVKDSFEVAGMPCTSGSPDLKNHIPKRNAALVDDLVNAGAVIFGKTNLPLFAMDFQSYNDVYGQTGNPWDASRVPGGSSGGAAAALAAGLTGLEIGSDIGGSIRNPAHFCGVYGHKPSFNLISLQGHVPPLPGMYPKEYCNNADLAVAGPLARSAQDLALVMDLLVKPKPFLNKAYTLRLPEPRKDVLKDFRVGLWLDDEHFPVDTQVGDCLQAAVDRLAAAGAKISDQRPEIDFGQSHEIFSSLLHAATSAGLPDAMYQQAIEMAPHIKAGDTGVIARWALGTTLRHRDWIRLDYQRLMMRQAWADYFNTFDVLLCPAMPVTAFEHDHSEFSGRTLSINGQDHEYASSAVSWAGLTGVVYLPSTVAPVGPARNGLPVGIQIVGPFLEDHTPIAFARVMADVTGGFSPPPGFDQFQTKSGATAEKQ